MLGGSTPAYAGWSASPTTAAAPTPEADASCQSRLSDAQLRAWRHNLGSGAWESVLTDVRGPFTVMLFQNDGAFAACFTSTAFTEISQVSVGAEARRRTPSVRNPAALPAAVPPRQVVFRAR